MCFIILNEEKKNIFLEKKLEFQSIKIQEIINVL